MAKARIVKDSKPKRKTNTDAGRIEFMCNPYWSEVLAKAPSKELQDYYMIMFNKSPFVVGDDFRDEEDEKRLEELWLSREDVQYLLDNTDLAQAKIFYQKCLDKLAAEGEEARIAASCLQGEIRNPWYIPEEFLARISAATDEDDEYFHLSAVIRKDDRFMRSITDHTIFKEESLGCMMPAELQNNAVQVEDLPENNLIMHGEMYTIPVETVEKIKTVIANSRVMDIKYLERPAILDGDAQHLFVRSGDRTNAIGGCNQWCYSNNEYTNAYVLMKVIDEVMALIDEALS